MVVALWMVMGLLVGAFAALLGPQARDVRVVVVTMVFGVIGALLGGLLGRATGLYSSFQASGGLVMAVGGAIVLLAVYYAVFARRDLTPPR